MPNLTFLEAMHGKPLVKVYSDDGVRSYPRAKRMTSHTVDCPTILDMYSALIDASVKGWCLLKGDLKTPLVEESRKHKTDRDSLADYLVVDIDGINLPVSSSLDQMQVAGLAQSVVSYLPEVFHEVSFIAQASASLGRNPSKAALHLFFRLEKPMSPRMLKLLMIEMNFTNSVLAHQIDLAASGDSLSYVLDPSIVDNGRIVYLAPPVFLGKQQNPFAEDCDRFTCVIRPEETVDLRLLTKGLTPEVVANKVDEKRAELREERGLKRKKVKLKTIQEGSGEAVTYVLNPDRMALKFAEDEDRYVRYNVNNGDSNAYWVHKYNPEFVFNFKDEPAFRFKDVDPETYAWHLEKFADYSEAAVEDFKGSVPLMFQDLFTAKYYNGFWDSKANLSEMYTVRNERQLANFAAQHQLALPENIPIWKYEFNPRTDTLINFKERFLNKYSPPQWVHAPAEIDEEFLGGTILTGHEQLRQLCPTIWKLMDSVCGNGAHEMGRFLNWLAFLLQKKEKAKTAWVFHGVPGTGKGLLFHKVLAPLIGERHVRIKTVQDMEERYNLWLSECLLFVVDEFRVDNRQKALINKLKNLITEPKGTVRAMHTDQAESDMYANIMFFSNDIDAVSIQPGDRRYNVAPRQKIPLAISHPDVLEPLSLTRIGKIEVPRLATYLVHFALDETAIIMPLENDAKRAMQLASEDTADSFVRALYEGDLDYFVPVLEEPVRLSGEDYVTPAKMIMQSILRDYQPNQVWKMTIAELLPLYNVLCGRSENRIKFGKMLAHHGLEAKKLRKHGQPPQQGLEVAWQIDDVTLQLLRNMYLNDEYARHYNKVRTHETAD